MVDERVLPHDLDAEMAVIGAVLIAAPMWPLAASLLREDEFFRDAHRRIFAAMRRVAERGQPIDFVTLKAELAGVGQLDEVGGPAYLASLTDAVPHAANVAAYAAIVREKAHARAVIFEANRLLAAAYDNGRPAAVLADEAIEKLTTLFSGNSYGTISVDAAVTAYASSVVQETRSEPVLTGYVDLDALLGGLRPSELVIVAARPSVGKSSFALGAAEAMARQGKPVLFFTLEMGIDGLASRLLAWRSGIAARAFERLTASRDELRQVGAVFGAWEGLPLYLEPTATTLTEVGAWCQRLRQEHGLACVVVDYLQLLTASGRHESLRVAVVAISHGLKRLAKALEVPVVALSQLSRAPEGRPDKRPHLSDLRESGALEEDCDLALLLFRPEMHGRTAENDGIAEVIVAKNRSGPTGTVRLAFDKRLAKFSDLAHER